MVVNIISDDAVIAREAVLLCYFLHGYQMIPFSTWYVST